MIPAQLATICRVARIHTQPYKVVEVTSEDVLDWKTFSQQRGCLRVRTSNAGKGIDWTHFMALRFTQDRPRIPILKKWIIWLQVYFNNESYFHACVYHYYMRDHKQCTAVTSWKVLIARCCIMSVSRTDRCVNSSFSEDLLHNVEGFSY